MHSGVEMISPQSVDEMKIASPLIIWCFITVQMKQGTVVIPVF